MIRRLLALAADLLSAAYLWVMLAGIAILPRLPDRARTDEAWLGCRISRGWGVDVQCRATPFGWLVEHTAEGAMLLTGALRAFLSAHVQSDRFSWSGYALLAAVALAQALLVLWALWRVGAGMARMIRRAAA